MSDRPPTPEQVICRMSIAELQELLGELLMDPSVLAAQRLRRLVQELDSFEAAIETIAGTLQMKDAA